MSGDGAGWERVSGGVGADIGRDLLATKTCIVLKHVIVVFLWDCLRASNVLGSLYVCDREELGGLPSLSEPTPSRCPSLMG